MEARIGEQLKNVDEDNFNGVSTPSAPSYNLDEDTPSAPSIVDDDSDTQPSAPSMIQTFHTPECVICLERKVIF